MLDLSRESSFRDSLGSRNSLGGVLGRKSMLNVTLRSLNDVPEESDESAEAAKLALEGTSECSGQDFRACTGSEYP